MNFRRFLIIPLLLLAMALICSCSFQPASAETDVTTAAKPGTGEPDETDETTLSAGVLTYDTETVTEKIPYDTVTQYSEELSDGVRTVLTAGIDGETTVTYRITLLDGVEIKREISERLTTPPVDEVVVIGTKKYIPTVIQQAKQEKTDIVAYKTEKINSNDLEVGKTEVYQKGAEGYTLTTYLVTYTDGVETKREQISQNVVAPMTEIIIVGTRTAASEYKFILPFDAAGYFTKYGHNWWVSSEYGLRGTSTHRGIDIALNLWEPILASAGGKVITAVENGTLASGDVNSTYGTYVVIDHGDGYQTLYAHLIYKNVAVGKTVKQGDIIGYCGKTGNTDGVHLHFEIRDTSLGEESWIDPRLFLDNFLPAKKS